MDKTGWKCLIMTNKKLKYIVEQIQKQAKSHPPPLPPDNYKVEGPSQQRPAGNTTTRPVPKPSGTNVTKSKTGPKPSHQYGYSFSPVVKTMQEAMLRLANVASSTDVTSMTGNKEGVMEGKQTRQVPTVDALPNKNYPGTQEPQRPDGQMSGQEQQDLANKTKDDKNYLGGSDPFGKFLVQNYIGKDSFIGKQYLNVDVAGQTNRENASMNPTNLRGIIDTIKRIGSPNAKGERVVDGVWQTRTNNALHVIADLTEAVMNLSKDMGVTLKSYTPEMLAQFKQIVPESWNQMKSTEDVNTRASALTKHLDAMTKMYEQFNADVLNNKAIRQFIDQREAFASFPKPGQAPQGVNPVAGLPGVQFNWIQDPAQNWISIRDLSSLDNFKRFLQRTRTLGPNPSNEDVKKMLDYVNNTISQLAPKGTKYETGY